jgi:hypothetical protein
MFCGKIAVYISHKIYSNQPNLFLSGQELEPEQYEEPLVPALQHPNPSAVYSEPSAILYMPDHYNNKDDIPHILATGVSIGNAKVKFVFKCLLDSGGTDHMINLRCIPLNIMLDLCASAKFLTTQGKFTSVVLFFPSFQGSWRSFLMCLTFSLRHLAWMQVYEMVQNAAQF